MQTTETAFEFGASIRIASYCKLQCKLLIRRSLGLATRVNFVTKFSMSWFWKSNKSKVESKLLEVFELFLIEDITITPNEIGSGSYGTVYSALYNGKSCVAKVMHPHLIQVNQKHANFEPILREITTLSSLRHPSIVQFLGVHADESPIPIIVMEKLWKSLSSVLEERPNKLPLLIKTQILYDVACGLKYLHGKKIPVVHRDLNAKNILLSKDFKAKIADLGQARALELVGQLQLSSTPGNIDHTAPEAIPHKPKYDSKIDIFSFGCIVIHTVTEQYPAATDQFQESGNFTFLKLSEVERRKVFLDKMLKTPLLRQITIQCLQMDAITRPTAAYICLELERYIDQLEQENPVLTQQYKEDRHSLWLSLNSQEVQLAEKDVMIKDQRSDHGDITAKKDEYISSLESQLQDSKNKVQELKVTAFSSVEQKGKELAEKDEINKQLTRTYQTKMESLRNEVKMKQEEVRAAHQKCTELQKVIEDLQLNLQQEEQKADSQSSVPSNVEGIKQEEATIITDKEEKTEDRMSILESQLAESKEQLEHIQQEKESLQKKLSEQDIAIKQLIMDHQRESTDKRRLEEIQQNLVLEKVSLQKNLDEQLLQLTTNQTETDKLREDLKVKEDELNTANLKIQKLRTKSKARKASIEELQRQKQFSDLNAHLQQNLLEVEGARREELVSYVQTFREQGALISKLRAELTDLMKSFLLQKQHLEDKSYRISVLQSSFNELQQTFECREQKLKTLEESNSNLTQLLDNNDRLQRTFENNIKSKEESLKRKEEELKLQKKEHADALNNLREQHEREVTDLNKDIEMYKSQADRHEEVIDLLKKEAQIRKSDSQKSMEDKLKMTENELRTVNKAQRQLKRQLKHLEGDIKEKKTYIASLTNNVTNLYPNQYSYNVNWYPSISLPIRKIRLSVAIIKGKIFMTGGYQLNGPQDKEMELYLQSLENTHVVFFYDPEKHQCDTIASPVQLGALASVNGQCVLVSGADSVGNTLTGNVYVLCEEGSHDQWKEFSKPLPTPRILVCACCYGNRWLIVCGGFACRPKEESSLLDTVNVVEILDPTKDEWYTLSEKNCPNFSTILCCSVVGEDLYVVGSDQVIKTSCNKLIKAATSNDTLVWDNVETEESNGKLYPFSVVEVNGEPMIIASMSDGEDDVTCVLMKDTRGRWRIMSKAVECQHCSAAVMTSSLELLLFGGSEKILVDEATDISQKGAVIPTLNMWGELW